MDEKISLETSKLITPENLRITYGEAIGNEVCFLLPMIAGTNKAVIQLLSTLSELSNTAQQMEFITTVRHEYYKRVANSILKEIN